ncbi:MAG: DUF4258 domain-containing protein [Chloroflexi bacterium]|nr:DUF4258 domain-containing protein [Chloroflexota bacterium]
MRSFDWSEEKNHQLQRERKISFEEVVLAIMNGQLLEVIPHPNPQKYPNQLIYVVDIGEYVYLIPFVQDEQVIFLKTIIPSRKATKQYLKKGK